MAKRTSVALTMIAAAMIAAPVGARAQPLARLTVQSFTLSTDNARPRVDTPFHLIVTLRVRERVDRVANLELPLLAELDLLGDERQTIAGSAGTQYRETITVVAHHSGVVAIAPATLQAVDARDGKAKQWYTNALNVAVAGQPVFAGGSDAAAALARRAFWILFWLLVFSAVVALLVVLLRRREGAVILPPPIPPTFTPPPTIVVRSRGEQLQDALTVLRAERTRGAALAVRNAVWRMLGASEGATLGDVLRRRESGEPTMRGLLVALERAAFTYDEDLREAVEDACAALQRSIEALA